jgi:hypothetical protein
MTMAIGDLRSNAVAILRLAGHCSMAPTGVVAQSNALISEASSPPPLRKFRGSAREVGSSCSFDSVRSLYAAEKTDPLIISYYHSILGFNRYRRSKNPSKRPLPCALKGTRIATF